MFGKCLNPDKLRQSKAKPERVGVLNEIMCDSLDVLMGLMCDSLDVLIG